MSQASHYAVGLVLLLQANLLATEIKGDKQPTLFENVVEAISDNFYDDNFRQNHLQEWVRLYEPRAAKANTIAKQLDVVQSFLSNIPSSHLGLISEISQKRMMNELTGTSAPTYGFELIEYDGKHYAFNVLEEGPAALAGIKRGDRVISIDGLLVDDSPRLGMRTDDAFLPDPPVRYLNGEVGDTLKLRIERTPGVYSDVDLPCQNYSAWEASQASARIIELGGKRIGVIHFWMIHMTGPDELLREKLQGEFASCDALILDLRGRGGNGFMVKKMLDVLEGITSSWNKPIAAIINEHSRSAKEVIASEFRKRKLGSLVGERTAGAVIPVTMTDVGYGMKLMYPTFTMPGHTDQIEFHGVSPDLYVAEVGPYSQGADPIFEAAAKEAVRLADLPIWKNRPKKKAVATKSVASGHRVRRHQPKTATSQSMPKSEKDASGYDAKAIEILEKMVIAVGGAETLRKHTSRTIRGEVNVGGMLKGTYATLQSAPSRLLETMVLPGMGKLETGYNGTVGWEISPQEGTSLMSKEDQEDMLMDADIYAELNLKKHHRSIKYVGRTEFNDKDCHEIRLTKHNEKVQIRYIDAESYLLAGSIGEVKTNMGPMLLTRKVTEYKDFDGEMIPVHYVDDVGGMQEMIRTVSEVSFDAISDKTFDIPKELVAIVKD